MPDVRKIEESLKHHNIPGDIADAVLRPETPGHCFGKAAKARRLVQVIDRMDATLERQLLIEVMGWCACCKGGSREADCKAYRKATAGSDLKSRIEGLSALRFMGNPKLNSDGTISAWISWKVKDRYLCPCPCFSGLQLSEPVSLTYCLCCAGHFLHHYGNALGVKLETIGVISSALNSKGAKPCEFAYRLCSGED